MRQYLRKSSLVVAPAQGGEGLDLSNFKFKFHIRQADLQTPNGAFVRVYNLSPVTISRIENEYTRLVLQVGYVNGEYGVVFDGDLQYKFRGRENATDTYLDLIAADGDLAYNNAFVNTTLADGSTQRQQVDTAVSAMRATGEVNKGYITDLPKEQLPRGKVLFGLARDVMRNVATSAGVTWSIQNRFVQVVRPEAYLPDEAVVLTAATGLIGMPEQSINGINVRCLINPRLKVGGRIKLDNESIQHYNFGISLGAQVTNAFVPNKSNDGLYRVLVIEHHGDTRGNEWYSELICVGIDDTAPLALVRSHGVV